MILEEFHFPFLSGAKVLEIVSVGEFQQQLYYVLENRWHLIRCIRYYID